jgi:hypothetical protein
MTNPADTNRYMGLAREALRATGAKLRKNFVEVFIEIMFLYVSVRKMLRPVFSTNSHAMRK